MKIRRAEERDIPAIAGLYDQARKALKAAGVDQWQDDYPNQEDAAADIAAGMGYVLEEAGRVAAYACLGFGREPTYDEIWDGGWQGEGEYGYLHRVAVAEEAKGRGAAGLFFEELKRQARARGVTILRGDTHPDNRAMQRVMVKSGLVHRGTIRVEDGSLRMAFEALLNENEG